MREIAALKALRTGDASSFLEMSMPNMALDKKIGSNVFIRDGVRDMMARGWVRRTSDMETFKKGIWQKHDLLAQRIIRDL